MEEKITFFGAYKRMWANTFNYKGTATLKEYWFPFIVQVLVACASCGLLYASFVVETGGLWYCLGAFALAGYLLLSLLPWVSLTVRRLRDAGKSGWWTLLLLIVGVGLLILMILCASASAIYNVNGDRPIRPFDPSQNEQPVVYGPPEIFDPSNNEIEEVYGPPFAGEEEPVVEEELSEEELNDEPIVDPNAAKEEEKKDEEKDDEKKGDEKDDPEFDPKKNEEREVYGPPEMFE